MRTSPPATHRPQQIRRGGGTGCRQRLESPGLWFQVDTARDLSATICLIGMRRCQSGDSRVRRLAAALAATRSIPASAGEDGQSTRCGCLEARSFIRTRRRLSSEGDAFKPRPPCTAAISTPSCSTIFGISANPSNQILRHCQPRQRTEHMHRAISTTLCQKHRRLAAVSRADDGDVNACRKNRFNRVRVDPRGFEAAQRPRRRAFSPACAGSDQNRALCAERVPQSS